MRYFLLILLLGLSLRAGAMGMFISADDMPVQIDELNIDVSVDSHSHIVTMNFEVDYISELSNWVWLLPLPSPETEISSDATWLQHSGGYLDFEYPPRLCEYFFYPRTYGSGGPSDDRPEVTTYERFETYDGLVNWLSREGYTANPNAETLLRDYLNTGHPILAIPLSQESESGAGTIQKITLSYFSEDLSIWLPLRLTAFSTGSPYQANWGEEANHAELPVEIEILADTQYAPVNVPHPSLDYEALQMGHPLNNIFESGYTRLLRETLATTDEGFVTTWAEMEETGEYLTVLQAFISPDDFHTDPIFRPAPDLPDLTTVDLTHHDALQFWRCSSRTLLAQETIYSWEMAAPYTFNFVTYDSIAADLPHARTHLPQFGLSVAHPADWVQSTLLYPQTFTLSRGGTRDVEMPLIAFAPEPVTIETIAAFERGESVPPMMIISAAFEEQVDGGDTYLDYPVIAGLNPNRTYKRPDYYWCCREMGIYLLISEAERAEHQAMYDAILAFPATYAYSSHADLLHTLYIHQWHSDNRLPIPDFEIGYPEGWIEYFDNSTSDVYFLPEGVQDRSQAVWLSFRVEGFRRLYRYDEPYTEEEIETYLDEMSELLNLLPEGRETLRLKTLENTCNPYIPPLALEAEGRLGFFVDGHLLTAAPNSPISDEELRMMAESYTYRMMGACG